MPTSVTIMSASVVLNRKWSQLNYSLVLTNRKAEYLIRIIGTLRLYVSCPQGKGKKTLSSTNLATEKEVNTISRQHRSTTSQIRSFMFSLLNTPELDSHPRTRVAAPGKPSSEESQGATIVTTTGCLLQARA